MRALVPVELHFMLCVVDSFESRLSPSSDRTCRGEQSFLLLGDLGSRDTRGRPRSKARRVRRGHRLSRGKRGHRIAREKGYFMVEG
jgi:hypothetical protein